MVDDPGTTGPKQDGRFKPGQSGNPSGRKLGTVNAATRMAQGLMAGDVEAIFATVIDKAKGGDMIAARLIVERLVPIPKASRYVVLDLPKLETPAHLLAAAAAITEAVAQGKIALEDVAPLVALIEATVEAVKLNDHDQRLLELERYVEDRRLHVVR